MRMKQLGKAASFERYMLSDNMPLFRWIQNEKISNKDINDSLRYTIEYGGEKMSPNGMQIMECTKDAYGHPYIPGSSIKGMLRTLLLCRELEKTGSKDEFKRSVERACNDAGYRKPNRKEFLSQNAKDIEYAFLRILDREGVKDKNDAVNDVLSGLVVSDSQPLSISDLVLCQKIDVGTDGHESSLNLLRECIKPDVAIKCTITIDTTICPYSIDDIEEAITIGSKMAKDNFFNHFDYPDDITEKTVWLGGGSGFVQKTLVYTLFPGREGVEKTKQIFKATDVPEKHKHNKDSKASPHMMKCTEYDGYLFHFGHCEVSFKEK